MEEWMQQQGRNRSYSMSYADNISFYQQQLQHKQRAQHQPPLAPPQHQSFPPGMDSFLQEGSPSSMSSCGSDDAAYSSDTVVTDYTPLHQLSQHHALEHQALPAQLQRRASLSSTPVSAVAGSLSILGGFVGEGLRAEYASRRPGGRRKSICLSPSENEQQMNHPGGADDGLTPDSEMPEQIEAMRRNSLPAGADGGQQRRNSLSCPLVHNYTPLTAVPTLGRALAEGNLGQRKSIQSFLSMLAQSSHDRSEKRRKRKGSRKGRGKRYKRNDYDESSDDDGDDSSEEGGMTGSGSGSGVPNGFVEAHGEPESGAFSGFDYSSGALAAGEGSAGSDSSSDAIPLSLGDQSTPGPYEPIAPLSGSGSDLLPPYSGGAAASDSSGAHSSTIAPAAYGGATSPTGGGSGRPRSLSSPPYYGDSQAPLTHHQQLQRQYHIAQTNKRLQELRQQHLERLQRQMEQQQRPPHQMGHHQQRHSYEFTPQHYAQPQQPYQPQQQVYPPQAHVLDLEVAHPVGSVARMASSSLPSVLPSHDQYPHHYGPPQLGHAVVQSQSLSQELMEQQVRADLDFYNEFSDFNMCEPASLESLCRTTTPGDQVPPTGGLASATEDGPVSEILDEFSLVVSSSSFPNGAWLGGAPQEADDGLVEKREQANDVDLFNDFFSLDDTSGVGSSH